MVCKDWAAASAMPSELWRQASGLDSLCGSHIAHEVYMADNLSSAIPRLPTESVVPTQIPHKRSDMHSLQAFPTISRRHCQPLHMHNPDLQGQKACCRCAPLTQPHHPHRRLR